VGAGGSQAWYMAEEWVTDADEAVRRDAWRALNHCQATASMSIND